MPKLVVFLVLRLSQVLAHSKCRLNCAPGPAGRRTWPAWRSTGSAARSPPRCGGTGASPSLPGGSLAAPRCRPTCSSTLRSVEGRKGFGACNVHGLASMSDSFNTCRSNLRRSSRNETVSNLDRLLNSPSNSVLAASKAETVVISLLTVCKCL